MKRLFLLFMLAFPAVSLCQAAVKPDTYYMQLAVNQARQNPKDPFAALIINHETGQILCRGWNAVNKDHNPTLHGEMVTINNCAKKYPKIDWGKTTLYTTAEPCPMCQGAIIWAGISRVVFGTSIEYLKEHHWLQIGIKAEKLNSLAAFYHGQVTGGILADRTNELF